LRPLTHGESHSAHCREETDLTYEGIETPGPFRESVKAFGEETDMTYEGIETYRPTKLVESANSYVKKPT